MTGTQDRIRAAFLAALMVLSMVAMTATFAGGVAASVNDNAEDIDTVFVGEEVTVNLSNFEGEISDDGGEILQIRQGIIGDGDGDRVATATVDNGSSFSPNATFQSVDTEDLAEDFHFFRVNGTNLQGTQFDVVEQDLDAAFDSDLQTADDSSNQDLTSDLNVSSENWDNVRGESFNITVNSDSFDQSQLLDIFDGEDVIAAGSDSDDPVEMNVTDPSASGTQLTADFDQNSVGVSDGDEFTFDVNSVESTASDTATVSVDRFDPADAAFPEGAYSGERGDIIDVTVDLENTDTGTVRFGSNSSGYNATVDFTADEVGDQVTIEVNTYALGSNASTVYNLADVEEGGVDSVNVVQSGISGGPSDSIIAEGSYDIEVIPGGSGDVTDLSSLVINPRETGVDVQTWTAPGEELSEISSAQDILDRAGENVTLTDQVAAEDLLVTEVTTSGLEGAIAHYGAGNDTTTEQFNQTVNAGQVDLTYTQTNPSRNNAPISFDFNDTEDNGDATVIAGDGGTYYIITDIGSFGGQYGTARDLAAGQNFDSEFTVSAEVADSASTSFFGLVPPNEDGEFTDETGTDNFDLVDRTASIDTQEVDGDDLVVVQPEPGQEVTGDASIAPGSEIDLRFRSQSGEASQFVDPYTVTVDSDRTWTLETDDFDGRIAGTSFDINDRGGPTIDAEGVIQAPDPANLAVSDIAPADAEVEQGTLIDVSATVENTGGQSATQNVTLEIAGSELGSQEVTLDAGGSQTVEFTDVDTSVLDEGDYTHTIASEDDSADGSLTITVQEEANFAVSGIAPADAEVEQGTLIDVSATVENTGDLEGTQTIALDIDGNELDTQEVTLAGGDSIEVEFTDVDTSGLDEGDYTHTISSEDDSASGSLAITVPAPAEFVVSDLNPAEAEFEQGADALSELTVSATVTNNGDLEGTQSVALEVDGDELATQEVTLAGGDSTTAEITVDASGLEAGDYTHTIATDDDSADGTLTITEPADGEDGEDGMDGEDGEDGTDGEDGADGADGEDGTDGDDGDDGSDDSGPGFGIVAALIAFIGAALLAVRRQN